ncbi:PREDICTED: caspase-3-like [Rhagoletis zephyria]|uniref:caspase-3-like n=1 Tax=Rhagoletis zephyria TaxID=28612 RepID=UPI0008116E9F|nr:PREDICTED: caspase-3-like [Rhagoletis zephyria]
MDEQDIFFFGSKKTEKTQSTSKLQAEADNSSATKNQVIISRPTAEVDYKTNNPNTGLAIVLNHKYLRGQTIRKGTEKDRSDVTSALENYGFEVRVYNDLKVGKISKLLKSVAAEDHSQSDCFVLVAMTHGDKGRICAADEFYSTEELWEPFLGQNCPTLLDKPKLFFIQACRGKRVDQPVMMTVMSRSGFDSFERANIPVTAYAIPTTADMLVMYSTFEDHYSFRHSLNGSWFIQSLCSVLNEAALDDKAKTEGVELLRLLTAVNRKVAYEYQSYHVQEMFDQKKEMPNFMSTLTKTFHLKVKPKRMDAMGVTMPDVEDENGEDEKFNRIFNRNTELSFIKGPVQLI